MHNGPTVGSIRRSILSLLNGMPRKVHLSNAGTNNKNLRTAVFVTLIAGLTLVLLSTAVFSLAATTRSLSTDAEKLHTADESLRAATTARAQLALALHGSRVDSKLGSDSSASIAASLAEAQLALDGFERSIALLDSDVASTSAAAFLDAARQSEDSLLVPTSDDERVRVDSELDDSYGTLVDDLTADRERFLAQVAQADRRMGTLGNLASFVVAFLLPTSAIFIYRQLARRPRRQVELEHELNLHQRMDRDRSQTLRLGLERFDAQVDAGNPDLVLAEARRLSAVSSLVYGQHTYDVARVELGETLTAIAAEANKALPCEVTSDELAVLVDAAALQLAVGTLVDGARFRGATRVHLAGRDAPATGKIEILTDGEVIAPLTIREAFLEATELTRSSDQQHRELVLARTLLEGMGARIEYHQSGEYEKFEITVPRAARSSFAKAKPEEVANS